MEKIFVIKGTNLTIHMPKELDHHNSGGDQTGGRPPAWNEKYPEHHF